MNYEQEFLEAAICIKHFDNVLTRVLERSDSPEVYLLQELYRLNFATLDMHGHNFFERKDGQA